MGPAGSEPPHDSSGKTRVPDSGGAHSGALSGDSDPKTPPAPPADPDLSAVAAAWPNLPLAIKAGILAMVRATGAAG
jgi:hypothetical protein